MTTKDFTSLEKYAEYSSPEMLRRSQKFYENFSRRRSIRHFSSRNISKKIIENCLRAAVTSPSGANKQPWTLAVVADKSIQLKIRKNAEKNEKEFYQNPAAKEWHDDLKELKTNFRKPFIEQAPYLIVIFSQQYSWDKNGLKQKHYYVPESVGIMTGILISAIHLAGLVTVTYTPSKSAFLNTILKRPKNEKPFMILPVGYPAEDAHVPNIKKKTLDEMTIFY